MKRIAIFLDGTWNTLNNGTNVWRLRSLCDPTVTNQVVYYGQGVGTRFGEKVRGGMSGYGLDNEILDAYSWLTQAFEPGDEIFIFGFSRGAYAARSLSGLISVSGVLKPGAPLSIEQLYGRYRSGSAKTILALLRPQPGDTLTTEDRWIVAYSVPTKVKLVGVWDTVGSLGNPLTPLSRKISQYKFFDTHLRRTNEFAFQALALDEHRKSFDPTIWTHTEENSGAGAAPARDLAEVEQRWFIGAHANVGGGYPSDLLAQLPLKWIMEKAASKGLRFRDTFRLDEGAALAPITDSYASFGNPLLRLFSKRFYRPVGTDPLRGSRRTTSRINETIDGSIFQRWRLDTKYRPDNLQNWAERLRVDPASLAGAVLATNPRTTVD